MIPQIKKQVNAFLLGEDGKISKKAFVASGIILASLALGLKSVKAGCEGTKENYHYHMNAQTNPNCDRWPTNGATEHHNSVSTAISDSQVEATHGHCVTTHVNDPYYSHVDHCIGCTWCCCW